jgi:RHS repeat-associated protein
MAGTTATTCRLGAPDLGAPIRFTDPDSASDIFVHDARGNLSVHIDPTGRERRFARDPRGLPLAILDGEGTARRFAWSDAGDLVAEGTDRGARRQVRHDRLGQAVEVRQGQDAPVRLVRDRAGNVVEIHRPDGGKVVLEYDPENRVVRHQDPLGRETRWRYDGLPFPRERVTADGACFRYAYDSELNLVGLENQKGERYRLDYDPAGRLMREVGFDGRTIEHDYDPSGRLVEQRDVGRPIRFRRDALGRLLEKRFADGSSHRFAWDKAGRLIEAANEARRLAFEYDPAGRLLAEHQDDQVLRHRYDRRGRRRGSQLPDGRVVQTMFGPDGLSTAVGFDGALVASFARDEAGRETERLAGGLHEKREYDPQGRLIAQQGFRRGGGRTDGGGNPVFARGYGYDGADALVQIEDARRGLKRYQYDACDRLLAVDGAEPEAFVVDPAGNILASGPDGAFWGGAAKGDRLLVHGDRKFAYDDYGNRIREQRAAGGAVRVDYRYDAANQLIEVDKTSRLGRRRTRFAYDALGRRVSKATADLTVPPAPANGNTPPAPAEAPAWRETRFLWDGNLLLAESTSADRLATVYLFEPGSFRPLAQVRREAANAPGQTYHYHLDHLGTPQEITNDNGELVWAGELKAWGGLRRTPVAKIENPLRFQGQYHDTETGLHYNRFRYYAPSEGRFINQDPIRLAGGTNVAAYAPNPVQWVDPFGLAWNPANAAAKYPGIGTTPNGGPTFAGTPYTYPAGEGQSSVVDIPMQGSRGRDFTQAWSKSGISPDDAEGYTWHHVDNFDPATGNTTMELVQTKVHQATAGHIGSVNQFENEFGIKYGTQDAVKASEQQGCLANSCKM